MKKFLVLLFIILSNYSYTFAADWLSLTDKEYIDKSSIEFDDDNVKFWFKRLNNGNMKPIKGEKVWYTLALANIKCSNRTVKISDFIIYGLKNTILFSDSNKYANYEPIIPDSFMEFYYRAFCTER